MHSHEPLSLPSLKLNNSLSGLFIGGLLLSGLKTQHGLSTANINTTERETENLPLVADHTIHKRELHLPFSSQSPFFSQKQSYSRFEPIKNKKIQSGIRFKKHRGKIKNSAIYDLRTRYGLYEKDQHSYINILSDKLGESQCRIN